MDSGVFSLWMDLQCPALDNVSTYPSMASLLLCPQVIVPL